MAKCEKIGPFRVRAHLRNGKPTGHWQLDIPPHLSVNGQRQRLMHDSKSEAIAEAKRRSHELMAHLPSAVQKKHHRTGISFDALVSLWFKSAEQDIELGHRRHQSVQIKLHHLKSIMAFLDHCDLGSVNEEKLRGYQLHRKRMNRSPTTINGEVGTITLILGWARRQGFISEVPTVRRLSEEQKNLDLPTIEEMGLIIKKLPARLQTLVLLLAETGCRKSEVFNLPWQHFNEVRGSIEIAPHRDWRPKNDMASRRTIPLSAGMTSLLRSLPKTSYYVFPGKGGNRPINNFRKALKTALEKSGVKRQDKTIHLTPHMIRKAYTSWQVRRGVPETVIQQLIGHAKGSRITQSVYTHPSEDDRAKAVFEIALGEQRRNTGTENLATIGNKKPQ